MIPVPSGVQVWLVTDHTHMRNYAEPTIMRSARREVAARRGFLVCLTLHNTACVRPRSAWPGACRAPESGRASARRRHGGERSELLCRIGAKVDSVFCRLACPSHSETFRTSRSPEGIAQVWRSTCGLTPLPAIEGALRAAVATCLVSPRVELERMIEGCSHGRVNAAVSSKCSPITDSA